MKLTPIIGLEIHVQLKTKSKMFCACDNTGENQPPNTTVCPICMGHPGMLPVANRTAIEWSAMAARAINCEIPEHSKFDRKSYFYPDLPKGYQISQYDQPIGINGFLEINGKKIGITRLHLEEDAAKNVHSSDGKSTAVDYNRSGTPLMEIVTEPDIRSAADAKAFMQELRLIMRYLGVSDADMEKGHLRCDANISLTDQDPDNIDFKKLSAKTEIKNSNSFKAVERSIEYEIKRQTKLWEEGTPPTENTTRGWNEDKGITEEQRTKEGAADYRYFPDPDLPPIHFNTGAPESISIVDIIADMPELPQAKRSRFAAEFELPADAINTLVADKKLATYFEQAVSELRGWLESLESVSGDAEEIWLHNRKKLATMAANWLLNKMIPIAQKQGKNYDTVTEENFAEFITLIHQNKINSSIGQKVLELMVQTGGDPSSIMENEDLSGGVDEAGLDKIIDQIIAENPKQVEQYKAGKETLIQFFIGQAMKATKGQANPEKLKELFENNLS